MPVTVERIEFDAVYAIVGRFDSRTAHWFIDLNFVDYNEVGDALGAIIDIQQASITISGLRTAQKRLEGVAFDAPVVVVGDVNPVFVTFMHALEALTSRGQQRFHFVKSVAEAQAWIAQWYVNNNKDRAALYGVKTTVAQPRYYPNEPPED
jgi:hypothetical protein